MEATDRIWTAVVLALAKVTIPQSQLRRETNHLHYQQVSIMPSKSKEKTKLFRTRLEQEQERLAEVMRQRARSLDEETDELGAVPVKCSMVQPLDEVTGNTKSSRNSVNCNYDSKSWTQRLATNCTASVKIILAIIIIGCIIAMNWLSCYDYNPDCPTIFPFSWICNKMLVAPKIVY